MNHKLTRVFAGVLSILCVGQVVIPVVSSAEEMTAAESFATPVAEQAEIVYANDLTIHGYVQKGIVDGFTARDNEPAYVRIFNGDWAEIATAEVAADGSYIVTASGSEVYHVKFECNGYLPFYLKDFGIGNYQVGSGDSDDTVTLVPGDTTYNADNDNQWSDDVLNSNDIAYVQDCVGASSYVAMDFNLSIDLNDDGIITQEELDEFCAFYTNLDDNSPYDLSDESADIDYFDVNDDGIINRYDYYLMYDLVYNERSPEIVNIPDLTDDGIFDINDLQPFWNRISEANDPDKWIWVYNHDMNRDGIVNSDDFITERLDYYGNPPLPSGNYHSYMDKNGNGCIDESDVAWFQAAYNLYGDLDWDQAFKRTLTLDANGKFNWSLNLHDTNLNLNGCALYVGDSMFFTTDIPKFWDNGDGAELNINGGYLETGNNFVFRTASPDGWDGTAGQNMYLNGGSVVIGGDFNFGQANCYDTLWMTNDNDYLEINHNWNYITLTDMEGKWTAGLINFQGPTWEVNEASGEKSVYSSGTHSIRFYYPDGKQTILWDNPNEYINAEDGTPNTLRTFNFDYVDPTTGECLGLIFPNGYSEELYWFRPWFEIEDTGEWIPYDEWDNYPDTDGDGLPDKVEKYIGTDPEKVDTDDDGLSDYDELFETFTDPTLYDTDGNGINDGQEDFDDDNLNNIEEIENGTDCYDEDTDGDGLLDGDEVKIYHSDPLKYDTDGDTLSDGDDVALGFDPTLPDTDFDGILDCDEKVRQTLTLKVDDETNPVESVSVSFEGTGNINTNTSITDIMGKDVLCSNVVGLVGNPYDINSTSQFDEAELSFKIRKNCLGETAFDELAILWYNEDEQTFELVDCTLDSANSVVKATLPHFSKYMIVNRTKWLEIWETNLDYSKYDSYNIVYAIDCSGSMEDLDPEPNASGTASKRHMAANNLIAAMEENDEAAVIGFNYTTSLLCDFTSDPSALRSALYTLYQEGSTNFNPVLSESISKLQAHTETSEDEIGKMIILISDGGMLDELDDPLNESLLTEAKNADIKIYTIGVGAEVDEEILHKIAEATGGEYYYASTNEEISDLSTKIGATRAKDIDMTDSDEDGLPDVFEIAGMQVQEGGIVYTAWDNPDTDGDGLLDGEEIIVHNNWSTGTVTFTMVSDPRLVDSDGDGIEDAEDEEPLIPISNEELEIKEFFENAEYFEILFVLENPWLQELGIQKSIKCVEICREYYGSTDWNTIHDKFYEAEIVQAPDPDRPWYEKILDSISCMDPAEMLLAEYENYSIGTSFAELTECAYESWSETARFAASIWLFGVSDAYCRDISSWDYSSEYKLSLEREQSLKTYVEVKAASESGASKINFSDKADAHLTNVEGFNKGRQGIVGGHKLQAIEEYSQSIRPIQIVKKTSSNVNGIMEIEYKVAKLDAKGNAIEGEWLNQTYRKTVYDSSIISDAEIMKYAREALESASVEIINGEIYVKGVASNDLWFEGWISSETGEIISYYPIIP